MNRKIRWKRIGIVAGIIVAIFVTVEVILAGRDTPPLPGQQSGITLKGGHVSGNRISTKSWTFDYETAQLSPDGAVGTVNGVKNGVIFKKGKPYMRVAAESISVDTTNLNFTAIGKVHASLVGDKDNRSFDTDLITWTNATKILRMDHPSYLHSRGQTLEFQTITVDFNSDQIHVGTIAGNVLMPKK